MNLEQQIQEQLVLANLPADRTTTLLVLEELKRLEESKAVGSVKGKIEPKKHKEIKSRHDEPRFVSSLRSHARAAGKALDRLILGLEAGLLTMIRKYRDGKMGFKTLDTRTKLALKQTTEQAFQLGVKAAGVVAPSGTLYPVTKREREWLDSYLREELKYWSKFLDDMKTASDNTIETRVHNYCETVRSAYESGRVMSVGASVVIHWELESHNPCRDCQFLSRHSPYTVDTLPTTPKGGQTRCFSYCYCSLRIVKTSSKEVASVKRKNKTAQWYLNTIKKSRKKVSKRKRR